jgi:predicted RNase H-like nuclease (RuvC/YqgF family)
MNNYVSTLETKVKSQDEEINKLKESNGELNDSNRMMSSKIDTLEKEHFGLSQYLRGNILIYFNFPEHVCLTACVGLPGLPPSGPK